MTTWTREHDDLIARVAEGGIAQQEKGIPARLWKYKFPDGRREHLPTYSTDLAACFRAAEAWKAIDVDRRGYSTMSASSSQPTAICWTSPRCLVGEDLYQGQGKEPSQALAWALYNAVKGIK